MENLIDTKSGTTIKLRKFAKERGLVEEFRRIFESSNINQLCKRIAETAEKIDCTDYEIGKDPVECKRKIKGDLFEVFCLLWLNIFGGERSIYAYNLKWAPRDMRGIDFFAINKFGNPLPIQCKFIANPMEEFKGDGRLETFFQEAKNYTVASPNNEVPMVILFTSTNKVGYRYRGDRSMLIVDRKMISKLASETNIGFWSTCKEKMFKIFS